MRHPRMESEPGVLPGLDTTCFRQHEPASLQLQGRVREHREQMWKAHHERESDSPSTDTSEAAITLRLSWAVAWENSLNLWRELNRAGRNSMAVGRPTVFVNYHLRARESRRLCRTQQINHEYPMMQGIEHSQNRINSPQ